MNKKEIKEQLREIGTAANSLANAISSLTVRLSCDLMLDEEFGGHQGESAFDAIMRKPNDNANAHHCGQDAQKPKKEITFDGSECEHPAEEGASLQDIMAQIKKDTDAFMNYLESIFKTQEQ